MMMFQVTIFLVNFRHVPETLYTKSELAYPCGNRCEHRTLPPVSCVSLWKPMRTPDVAARQDSSVTSHGPRTKICTEAPPCTAVVQGGATPRNQKKVYILRSSRETVFAMNDLWKEPMMMLRPTPLSRESDPWLLSWGANWNSSFVKWDLRE